MSFDLVNGYICHNCTDVDYAKKHIDPRDPKAGPYGVNKDLEPGDPGHGPAVTFGGSFGRTGAPNAPSSVNGVTAVSGAGAPEPTAATSAQPDPQKRLLDISV
jgi:hypothetical protein